MNTKEKLIEFIHGVVRGTARFPLAVFFALVLTVVSIVLNHVDHSAFSEGTLFFMYWYPLTAMFLSVALSLWYEERRNRKTLSIYVLAEAVWLTVLFLSREIYAPDAPNMVYVLIGVVALLVTAVLILPFLGKSASVDDVPFWNFSVRCLISAAVAVVVAGALCGGLYLLLFSLRELFGLSYSDNHNDIALVCFLLIAPICAFQGIPDKRNKYDSHPVKLPALIVGAVRYLFIPLTAIYMGMMYVYAAKILLTWELPHGWVSWPVSISMLAVTALFVMFFPYLNKDDEQTLQEPDKVIGTRLAKLITFWFPLLMLPLLVLMSVGIIFRVSQYGVSILRIYLIFFNLWCYAVCAFMAFRPSRRVAWIPMSAVVLYAVLSVFPVNVTTIVRERLTARINEILTESLWDGKPMDEDGYREWIQSLDEENASKAAGILNYLKQNYGRRQVENVVDENVYLGYSSDDSVPVVDLICDDSMRCNNVFAIPENATAFMEIHCHTEITENNIADDVLSFPLSVETESGEKIMAHFSIPMADLRSASEGNANAKIYYDATARYGLAIRSFSLFMGKEGGSWQMKGLMFLP